MNLVPAEDIKKLLQEVHVLYIKFVRIGNTYRFAFDAEWSTPSHKQMFGGETPTSAGSFRLCKNDLEWENPWSTTLGLGVAADDLQNLKTLFLDKHENY